MRLEPWTFSAMTLVGLVLGGLPQVMAQPARIDRPGGEPIIVEQPGGQPREVVDDGADAIGRPCRTDRLIIDYVGEARQEIDLEQLGQRFAARLRAAPNMCQGWFGRPGQDCRPSVRRIVDQDTANRAGLPQLSPLHVEMTFVDGGGQALALSENAVCDAVSSVRWLLTEAYGERAEREFYVARACDASVQGDWAGDAVHAAAPPLVGRRRAGIVAIVDGPHTREGDAVVQPQGGLGDGPVTAASVDYAHADAVGLLVRRASPGAMIRYYTALDPQAMGSPIGRIAQAIARAAADAGNSPLVVNLSLGWPGQMQRNADVSGPSPEVLNHFTRRRMATCRGTESPAGEVVRAWMRGLRDRDVVFVAAAGNRRAAPDPGAPVGTPTKPAAMFYPAGWTPELPNLLAVGAYGRRPVPELGVGAHDRNRPDLYAPGLRVPTLRPASLSAVVPTLLTGTSGATALVSGTLANSPQADRKGWLRGRLTPCPVQALPGTRALFLGACPDADFDPARGKRLRPARITPRRPIATPRTPLRPTLGRAGMPRPGNGARIAIDRYDAGSVGPQPGDDGCLVPCRFLLDASGLKGDLRANIDLGAPAIVKSPRLVFRSGAEKDTVFLPASGVPTSAITLLKLNQDDIGLPPPIKVDKSLEISLEFELEPASGGKTVRREVALQVLQQSP